MALPEDGAALQDNDAKQLFSFLIWKTQSCLQSRWGRRCRSLDGTSSFEPRAKRCDLLPRSSGRSIAQKAIRARWSKAKKKKT